MKFEEQFPSLKGKAIIFNCSHPEVLGLVRTVDGIERTDLRTYCEEEVQEHCLDKQKVRDALIKVFSRYSDNISRTSAGARLIHEIETELEL